MRLAAAHDFSTVWKNVFHTVEKRARFFHTMEKCFTIFPHNGKNVSTLWKIFREKNIRHKERIEHKESPLFCALCDLCGYFHL